MIRIENIFYMLAYAFRALRAKSYESIAHETFDHATDLLAEILLRGLKNLIRQGLGKDYVDKTETISSVRGKIDISLTLKSQALLNRRMICTFDDYSENTTFNQILKVTMKNLLYMDVSQTRKSVIRKTLSYFNSVDDIDINTVRWDFRFNRSNSIYELLVNVCYLIWKSYIQNTSSGSKKQQEFDEESMSGLYERFILNYYKIEHPDLSVSAPFIKWKTNDQIEHLPIMRSDVVITDGHNTLIIDAKYYSKVTQTYRESTTFRSNHLYQIHSYVRNYTGASGKINGLLLYARPEDYPSLNYAFETEGHTLGVRALDLGTSFSRIKEKLDEIIIEFGLDKTLF